MELRILRRLKISIFCLLFLKTQSQDKSSKYWASIEKLLSRKSGVEAIDLPINAKIDYTKFSGTNLERVASIIEKFGSGDRLIALLKSSTDMSRMLIFLDNMVKNLDDYQKILSK